MNPTPPATSTRAGRTLARVIDHTALKPDTTEDEIRRLCDEALQYGFATVCVNPCYVPLCARLLAGSPVGVCTVIGFPLGANATEVKAREAELAIQAGADEVDMVINVGWLKSGREAEVEADIRAVVEAAQLAGGGETVVKVIIETALLTDAEKETACRLAEAAGADFVKTSTGFAKSGATAEDIALMRRVVGNRLGVKASGGVRTFEDARLMVEHGANRIGASASVAIVTGGAGENSY